MSLRCFLISTSDISLVSPTLKKMQPNISAATSRSVNMGVFGADLSYCTLYNINQEVIDYLNAIRTLANELNMSKIYDETLYDRIKANVDNKDELVIGTDRCI